MRKGLLVVSILLGTMALTACSCSIKDNKNTGAAASQEDASSKETEEMTIKEPQKITAEEAYQMMQEDENSVIVDVRTQEEYEGAHIPGAILIPNEEITDMMPKELPDLDAKILIYCRSGNRSAQAAEKLSKMGYTNLYDFGGINDWTYETESGPMMEMEEPAMTEEETGMSEEKKGTLASFTATDLDGNMIDETIYSGHKLTMINIWATFCGPCLSEMPGLGELAMEYKEKGAQVVGIVADVSADKSGTFDESQVEEAKELVKKTGADYLHLLPSQDLITAKLNEVSSVPETIFVDETGSLVGESYVGARSKEEWSKIIDQLLEEAK